jgi:hypothetical protein
MDKDCVFVSACQYQGKKKCPKKCKNKQVLPAKEET